ncbi:MAG: hypothetical protein FGM39_04705 [Phycisphaerales bacterium]|nr:hypothetical protein [Phycisphaerales bacterium]
MVQGQGRGIVGGFAVLGALGAAGLCHAQVSNDDRANATRIRPAETVTALTALATPSTDPLPSADGCQFLGWSAPRKDVWYRFDPPQPDGLLTLDLCESNFDTSVVLYRLDPASGAIEQIACDDDDCNPAGPTYQSRIAGLRLVADTRPVLVRVAGWSNQVGTLRMRADWTPAGITPARFTAGGLYQDGQVTLSGQQSSSQGPGSVGPVHAFVQGQAQVGAARAGGFVAASVTSGWSDSCEVRLEGSLEATQPANAGATSRFRCIDGNTTGASAPLELTLDAERYFRISSPGSVPPTFVAGSGCICGNRLSAGTYLIEVDFGVALAGSDSAAAQTIDWRLELSTTPFRIGDLDGDGAVDGNDLGHMLAAWGGSGPADINRDGTVNADDLGALLGDWGT